MNLKTNEQARFDENGSLFPAARTRRIYRSYTFDLSEADEETLDVCVIPADFQVVGLCLYHDALGNVTLRAGVDGDNDCFIQSEDAAALGCGWLGQGVSQGKDTSTSDRTLVVFIKKFGGVYTSGTKIKIYVTLMSED